MKKIHSLSFSLPRGDQTADSTREEASCRKKHAGKNTTHSVNTCKHLLDIIRYSVNINKHLLDEEDSFSLPRGDQTADLNTY